MIQALLDLLSLEFFTRALIGGVLIGIVAPIMGVFLVLRRLSMIGDTLAHISIAGVALGFIVGVYPLAVGLLFAVVATLAIEKLRKAFRSFAELSIAIMMSTGIALASLLYSTGLSSGMNIESYLFGSIYTLDELDLWLIGGVALLVIAIVVLHAKELFVMTYDEEVAKVHGLPTRYLNVLLSLLTALVIGVSIKIVGALLVSALLTVPVACSLLVARSFRQTMSLVVILAQVAVISGLLIAGVWNLAPGGTIVMVLVLILISLLVFTRKRTI